MNNNNTVCNSGHECTDVPVVPYALQDCDPPLLVEMEAPKPCIIDTITLGCSHGRNVVLELFTAFEYHVLVKPNETETFELNYTGACEKGGSDCVKIALRRVGSSKEQPLKAGEPIELKAPKKLNFGKRGFFDAFKFALNPMSAPKDVYEVLVSTCSSPGYQAYGAIVVHGQCGAEVGIGVGFSIPKKVDKDAQTSAGYDLPKVSPSELDTKKKLTVTGEASLTCGPSTKKFVAYYSKVTKGSELLPYDKLFVGPQRALRKTLGFMEKAKRVSRSGAATASIEWPNVSITGAINNKEVSDNPYVASEGSISVGLNPLIGLQGELDILTLMLNSGAPGVGTMVDEAIKLAGKGFDHRLASAKFVLEAILTVGGRIKGDFTWTAQAPYENHDPGAEMSYEGVGSATGEISLGFRGKVAVEGRLFIVKATAGAGVLTRSHSGKGDASISTTLRAASTGSWPEFSGSIECNGLSLYYILYAEYGVTGLEKEKDPKAVETHNNTSNSYSFSNEESKAPKELWKIYEGWKLPNDPKLIGGTECMLG